MNSTPCKYYKYGEPVGIPLLRRVKRACSSFWWSLRSAIQAAYSTVFVDKTERPWIECSQEEGEVVMFFTTPSEPFHLNYELAEEKEVE